MSKDDVGEKLGQISEHLGKIDVTLAKQSVVLEHHIRRSDMIEKRVEQVAAELAPIKTHVAAVGGVVKALAILGTSVGLIVGLAKIAETLHILR